MLSLSHISEKRRTWVLKKLLFGCKGKAVLMTACFRLDRKLLESRLQFKEH